MADVVDVRSKLAAQRAREREEAELVRRVERAIQSGDVHVDEFDDDLASRGCGGRWSCGLMSFGRGRRRHAKLASADAAAAQARDAGAADTAATSAGAGEASASVSVASAVGSSGSELGERLFGRRAGAVSKKQQAAAQLQAAAQSIARRVEQLAERKAETAQRVVSLKQAGKTAEAIAMLKRLKQVEKQHASASAAQIAIEQQVDMLAEADLQREVSAALTASLSTVKKRSKGLLSSAESAADDALELRDLNEDVAQALGGLQVDQYDDDELMAELNLMMADASAEAPAEAPVAVAVAATTPAPAAVAVAATTPAPATAARFPTAPTTAVPTGTAMAGV